MASKENFNLSVARDFVRNIPAGSAVGVIMDGDADGLSAGRIFEYALRRLGKVPCPIFPGKGEWAYSAGTVRQVRGLNPQALIIVDTGSSAEESYAGIGTMVVDHHRPLGLPRCEVYVNSYGRTPKETSSLISFYICRELVDLEPIEWVVSLGVFGDLGDSKAFGEVDELAKLYKKSMIRKAVSLLNSARRSSACNIALAYEVLKAADSPRTISEGKVNGVEELVAAQKEINAELQRWSKQPPEFRGENVWVPISSRCLIHALLASRWSRTLNDYRVLVSNEGYIPKEVVFSFRSRRPENLILYLKKLAEGLWLDGTLGFGHDRATGGRLSADSFARLIRKMGFK